MPAATAYFLTVLGVLFIYTELVRPGAVVPGSLGALLFCWGGHGLGQHHPQPDGIALWVVAVLLFAAEARWRSKLVAGALGTLMLAAGSRLLLRDPLPWLTASVGALLIGIPSTLLAALGRRARQNKTI